MVSRKNRHHRREDDDDDDDEDYMYTRERRNTKRKGNENRSRRKITRKEIRALKDQNKELNGDYWCARDYEGSVYKSN